MQKTRARHITPRASKKVKSTTSPSREVTANEVIQNLLNLFERVGIEVRQPISRVIDIGRTEPAFQTLYPYAYAIGELLITWHQDPEYLDTLGNPAPIKLRGPRPSFRSLAKRMVPNMDASYLLSELERLGAVTIDESKLIHVHMRSFPAYEDRRLAIQHTLTTLDAFIKTLRHNLDSTPSNSDQLFHRVAWNGDFDSREIPALKIRVKRHGQSFLESFDSWLTRKALSKSRKPIRRTKRAQVSIGVYLSVKK
jgi:Family of unknown function (DUF6502)